MKQYPSIPNSGGQSFRGLGVVDVFDKLDGNNIRFEFSRKRGWYKAGTRTQMLDASNPLYGPAVTFFHESMADLIVTDCFKRPPERIVVFCEWWGPNSFAGLHQPGDEMRLTLFDASLKNGWIDPRDFRKTFEGKVDTPRYLGQHNWTRGFIERVRDDELDVTFEGVVGKTMQGSQLLMGKAKTAGWIQRIRERYSEIEAAKLIAS